MPRLTEDAVRDLQSRPWRGNVRELENVIEHAVVLLEPGREIHPDDIPRFDEAGNFQDPVETDLDSLRDGGQEMEYHAARERMLAQFERRYLRWVVEAAEGNLSEAARIASVDRTTLYRLMDKHDLTRDHFETDGT